MKTNNQGKQTELVKNAIVAYIRDWKLSAGDKLPTQSELRKHLGVGNVTIGRAIEALRDDGILETRGRVGVFVRDASADGYIARQIGIVEMRLTEYPFGASLLQCLLIQLHDHGCQAIPFLRTHNTLYDSDSLDLFTGLRRNIRQKRIDGIITTVSLDHEAQMFCKKNHIPVYGVGVDQRYGNGVFLDIGYVIRKSLNYLLDKGFRRPALVCSGYPLADIIRKEYESKVCNILPGKSIDQYCRILSPKLSPHEKVSKFILAVRSVVTDFLAMPSSVRPDSVLIPDDLISNWFYTELMRQQAFPERWEPEIIGLRNVQLPFMGEISHGRYFEVDIMKMANLAVDMLLSRLRGETLTNTHLLYKPLFK